jgi:hypothetical protein
LAFLREVVSSPMYVQPIFGFLARTEVIPVIARIDALDAAIWASKSPDPDVMELTAIYVAPTNRTSSGLIDRILLHAAPPWI